MPAQRIHFNTLPAETRKYLEVYLRARGALLSRQRASGVGGVLGAIALSIGLGVFAVVFARAQLARNGAIPWAGLVVIGPAIGFPLALLGAALGSLRKPPFVRGVYVFPTDLVVARGPIWTIKPIHECSISGEHWIARRDDLDRLFPSIAPQTWTVRVDGHVFDTSGEGSLKAALRNLHAAVEKSRAGTHLPGEDRFRAIRGTTWSTTDSHPADGVRYTAADQWAARATWLAFVVGLALAPLAIVIANK